MNKCVKEGFCVSARKEHEIQRVAEQLQNLLCKAGVRFFPDGFPDLTPFSYTTAVANDIEMWPYSKRNQAANLRKTIVTFFEADQLL